MNNSWDPSYLSNAIIMQAAIDYLKVKALSHLTGKPLESFRYYKEVINFFNSSWYEQLTEVKGKTMLRMLDNKFDNWVKNGDNNLRNLLPYKEKE